MRKYIMTLAAIIASPAVAGDFSFEAVEVLNSTEEVGSFGVKSMALAVPGDHLNLDSLPQAVVTKAITFCAAGKSPNYTIPSTVDHKFLRNGKITLLVTCGDKDGDEIHGVVINEAQGITCQPFGRKFDRSRLQQFQPKGAENNCIEKEGWSRVNNGSKYIHLFWGDTGKAACNQMVGEFKGLFYENNDDTLLFSIRNHSGDRMAITEKVSAYLTQRLTCETTKSQTFKTSVENAVRAERLSTSNYDYSTRDQKDRDKILKSPFGAPVMAYCKEMGPLRQKVDGFKYGDNGCQETDSACIQSRTVKINEVNSAILTASEKLKAAIKKNPGEEICCKMTPGAFVYNPKDGKCAVKPVAYPALAH